MDQTTSSLPREIQTPWGMATLFGKTQKGLALMFARKNVTDQIFLAEHTRKDEHGRPEPGANGPCFFYDWQQQETGS